MKKGRASPWRVFGNVSFVAWPRNSDNAPIFQDPQATHYRNLAPIPMSEDVANF
jgi:hypothetical protein